MQRLFSTTIITGIVTALAFGASINPAWAKVQTLCVDPSNLSCSATIQAAVDQVLTNAIITVAAGNYPENVSINPQVGKKAKSLTLTIEGAGIGSTIVDGGALATVFTAGPKTTLTLSRMTIQNGNTTTVGGGIASSGTSLTLDTCVVTQNVANQGGGVGVIAGNLTITNSVISANSTAGASEQGGGIYINTFPKKRIQTITNSTISGNTATQGAGVFATNPKATILGSTVSGNTASPLASGIGGFGGGILVSGGKLSIYNSTISGNVAEKGSISDSIGGGLELTFSKVAVNNVTIANNTAGDAGGVDQGGGGSFRAANSIIASNTATNMFNDCAGPLASYGFNLIQDTNGCTITGFTVQDITGQDPLLQPLGNNGGTTETQALGIGSPALTKGDPSKPSPSGSGKACLATDQIGNPRATRVCDMGALQQSVAP